MKRSVPVTLVAILLAAQLALLVPARRCLADGRCGSCEVGSADLVRACCEARPADATPAAPPERSCCAAPKPDAAPSHDSQVSLVTVGRCCTLALSDVTATADPGDHPPKVAAPALLSAAAAPLRQAAEVGYAHRFHDPRGPPPAPRRPSAVLRR